MMVSQKAEKGLFPSFRLKPESTIVNLFQVFWTPVFTGVTASYESVILSFFESFFLYRYKQVSFKTPLFSTSWQPSLISQVAPGFRNPSNYL